MYKQKGRPPIKKKSPLATEDWGDDEPEENEDEEEQNDFDDGDGENNFTDDEEEIEKPKKILPQTPTPDGKEEKKQINELKFEEILDMIEGHIDRAKRLINLLPH